MKRSYLCLSPPCVAALSCRPSLAERGVTQDATVSGQVAALEGPAGLRGREFRDGLLAAFEEANSAGGVKGRKPKCQSRERATNHATG
jgi:ABC-type branched-subunit amino acid transport system substrate-binding protein